MSGGQRTAGPWHVEVDDASGIGRTHSVYICDSRGWPEGQLARVNTMDGFGEREANALVLAAAPDLLEAAQYALEALEGTDRVLHANGMMKGVSCPAIEPLRAAIARATGPAK